MTQADKTDKTTTTGAPHERDQSTDMTPDKQSPAVQQAGKDVAKGLKDTSKHPEMDAAYKKQT
ncbi:MAG: hypothetical protein EOO54_11930 [Haliea sp.]|nr:MAG: hypothetical protein EOO54_11930 [Haliea sp.]